MTIRLSLVFNVEVWPPEILGVYEGADVEANNVVYSYNGVMHNAPLDCCVIARVQFDILEERVRYVKP